MLHILWMFIVGIVVGFIARAIMPGTQHMGILMTGVLGVAGSIVGGLVSRLFSKPADGAFFHPAGIILSILGAILILFLWGRFMS
ncbi:MAG TPA: GlsB/YeaQ/YmgE family stress response membrane protein [Pyrinomonadaceae bacterium]|nr:GlsB/YeaQ/YmgE family stress response membrane protein [Pyrinomonadaceae bacterium]